MPEVEEVVETKSEDEDSSDDSSEIEATSDTEKIVKPKVKDVPERPKPKTRYKNKQRTLVFASRGVNERSRHLMKDLIDLLPHSKTEPKLDVLFLFFTQLLDA